MRIAVSNIAWPVSHEVAVAEALAALGVFEIEVAPDHGRGWGLPAILGRAQALGGDVSLFNNDDGGATLRVCIPTGRGDADPH